MVAQVHQAVFLKSKCESHEMLKQLKSNIGITENQGNVTKVLCARMYTESIQISLQIAPLHEQMHKDSEKIKIEKHPVLCLQQMF